jgi:SAM-dependent methyltransferase
MKNISQWQPTKIQCRDGNFFVNPSGMASGSLYITLEAFRVIDSCKSYLRGHLLDLGCGNVPYYEWYKNQVDKVTCIDWHGSLNATKHIDIFADLNKALPLENESVDCVLSTSVLEHICEPQVLFKEISRILAKDGYLILSVPFLYHLHEEPFDYYRYTPHGLKHLAKEAGLEIVSLEHYGSAFGVLVDISSKITEVIINGICKFMPKFIAAFIKKLGDKILCLFQQICFFILKQKPVLQALKISKLSPRIALGYIAVFTVNKEI